MQDNEPINLTYGQMSDMVNRIEQIPSLSGAGAPTSSTPAFHIGQTYLDTTTDELYYCASIPGENDPLEYTWEPIAGDVPEYVAGDNVTITDESGSMVISATDTTYSNFTGTDGAAAGTSGLVPAPATTDAGKFLKADGTWETVQAGGGATIFYKDSGLVGWGEDIEGPLFYKDSSYQTPATSSDIYAACMAGTTYICSNQSDDLFYTEIVAASNYSTNYNFSLTNIEHGLGYDCTISSYISGGTEYYSFYYNEPVSINVVQTTGSSTTNVMSQNAVTTALSGKQGTLTAGTGILINNNVISATSGGLVTISYGHSTWNDFITAYNAGEIVYCRASSDSDPGVGSQTRMAFMAYVNNATNPTEVEFQYIRSVSTKNASNQSDQVFVYKLTNAGTWTVETRPVMVKIAAGTNAESSYASNTLTINPRLYTTTGQNTDGGVTQKLFTDTVGNIESALNLINNGGGN